MTLERYGLELPADPGNSAFFNPDRRYRYWLSRTWDRSKSVVAFVGLNPSTADENKNDPTVERCIDFAKRWGHGGLLMLNIFAYRSTKPEVLQEIDDPVGLNNDLWLVEKAGVAEVVVACWGNHGSFLDRGKRVYEMLSGLKCLDVNQSGEPKHPLYVHRFADLRKYDRENIHVECNQVSV